MKEMLGEWFSKLITEKKSFKVITWIFILLLILITLLYPIIDANFLYYGRTNKRVEIIQKIGTIGEETLSKDERIRNEYNSILDEMDRQSSNYLNNIFEKETDKGRKVVKFIAGAWLFIIVGLIMLFTRDKSNGKRFTSSNIMASILCFTIAVILGYIGMKIPNIINILVNIMLYQVILVFLAYTIGTSSKKAR